MNVYPSEIFTFTSNRVYTCIFTRNNKKLLESKLAKYVITYIKFMYTGKCVCIL